MGMQQAWFVGYVLGYEDVDMFEVVHPDGSESCELCIRDDKNLSKLLCHDLLHRILYY